MNASRPSGRHDIAHRDMDVVDAKSDVPHEPFAWRFPARSGNELRLFTVGDEAFESAYEAIRSARERVWLETYILQPDEVGNMARDALADAAARGCDVILLFDRWGSPRIGPRYARPITEAGGRVVTYNPALPWRKFGRKLAPFYHRDHRKILITDEVGFTGGANVSRDYGGPGPELFFDLTVRFEGPCVRDLAAVFLDSVLEASGSAPAPPRFPPAAGEVEAQVLALNRRKKQTDLDRALQQVLIEAVDRCFLMTPYFVPPAWFVDLLTAASQRGVDVRILTAGRSDVPLARIAGRHLYRHLLEAGIEVFEMEDPILHAKCITVDGRYSVVGSYNVDAYGGKHNLEVGLGAFDRELSSRLEAVFAERCATAKAVNLEEWRRRPVYERILERTLFRLFRV